MSDRHRFSGCLVLGLTVSFAVIGATAAPAPAPDEASNDAKLRKIPPAVRRAMIESYESNKPLLIEVGTEWCGHCKRFQADVAKDTPVKQAMKEFVLVSIDAEKDQRSARYLEARGYPTFAMFAPSGERIAHFSGYWTSPNDAVTGFAAYIGEAGESMLKAKRYREAKWLFDQGLTLVPQGQIAEYCKAQSQRLVDAGKVKFKGAFKWKITPELAAVYQPKEGGTVASRKRGDDGSAVSKRKAAPRDTSTDEKRARALLVIGKNLAQSNKLESARKKYARVVKEYPDTAAAAEAKTLLAAKSPSP